MRYITDQNQNEWVERFAELKMAVEWGGSYALPSIKVDRSPFTYRSFNSHPDAAEALWSGNVSLALRLVSTRT